MWQVYTTQGRINIGMYMRAGGAVECVLLFPVWRRLGGRQSRRTVSSSVWWSWLLAARVSTSEGYGRRGDENQPRKSAGGGAWEFNKRKRMVVEQRVSGHYSRPQSMHVKCSTQETIWGSSLGSTTDSNRRGRGNVEGRARR